MKYFGFAASILLIGVLVIVDRLTSYELVLSTYYLGPVVIAAWFSGRWSGLAVAMIAGLLWVYIDYHSNTRYTAEYLRYWKIAMVFVRFSIGALLLSQLRSSLDLAKQLTREKDAALVELNKATAKIRELEGSFQTVCSWTKKIKDGDEWITLEEYLRRHLKIEVTHGISPEGRSLFWEGSAAGRSKSSGPD